MAGGASASRGIIRRFAGTHFQRIGRNLIPQRARRLIEPQVDPVRERPDKPIPGPLPLAHCNAHRILDHGERENGDNAPDDVVQHARQ